MIGGQEQTLNVQFGPYPYDINFWASQSYPSWLIIIILKEKKINYNYSQFDNMLVI